METIETYKFCRVCLVPEETETFTSIFNNNASLALKIHKLAGVLMLDINDKVPSLICLKCIGDIEAVEKLKMRILDADEYYAMITMESEKQFLDVDMQQLMNRKPFNASQSRNSSVFDEFPELVEIQIKQEPIDIENVNPRKRKRDQNLNSSGHKATPSRKFLPKATPNKLGIHRMVIKTKTKSSKSNASLFHLQTSSTPVAANSTAKKKKMFRPKINIGGSSKPRSKRRTNSDGQHVNVLFECDNCKKTFESCQLLNDHLVEHNFDEPYSCELCEAKFTNDEDLKVHIDACHNEMEIVNVKIEELCV